MTDRISDDSGLISDDTWEGKTDHTCHSISTSSKIASFPSANQKLCMNDECDEFDELSSFTTDSSPWEEKFKPVPAPRSCATKLVDKTEKYAFPCDNLKSVSGSHYYHHCTDSGENGGRRYMKEGDGDEIFEEIEFTDEINVADYVNLNELFVLGSDLAVNNRSPPALPIHRPPNQWESKLYQLADRCLSTVIKDNQTTCCSQTLLQKFELSKNNIDHDISSSPSHQYKTSTSNSSPSIISRNLTIASDEASEYHMPPDATRNIRATFVNSIVDEMVEKCGYLIQMSDNRLRSLKRRYFVLKNDHLTIFKNQKNFTKNEEFITKLAITDILSVSKISNKIGFGLQIQTLNHCLTYSGESDRVTSEWFNVLNRILHMNTISEVVQRANSLNALISGYVLKARCGASKRYFAAIVDNKLVFFKNSEDKVPCSHVLLKGAKILERSCESHDEYSGSSDDQCDKVSKEYEYIISVESCGSDPIYVALKDAEEKEKWAYYMRKCADSVLLSPFEIFIEKLMAENSIHDSQLWDELKRCEEEYKQPLWTKGPEALSKTALELGRSCYMFTSVLMRTAGVEYHIDLAQNILTIASHNDSLVNELYVHLIKLTSGSMANGLQAWKLLALTCPLFTPRQYSLLWLLRRHVERWTMEKNDEGKLALYCENALNRCLKEGERKERPSKIEIISILTRDPTATKMPHSIPVLLPSGDFCVVDFDGSTDVGICLSSVCAHCVLRPPLLSGYALYLEDSSIEGSYRLLNERLKICDCLSRWEREFVSKKVGRVTYESTRVRLSLRQRHYWSHLEPFETPNERIFLVYRMAHEVIGGRVPMSCELAEELAALYAQMTFGDIIETMTDEQFGKVTTAFYPRKLLDVCCERTLRENIASHWVELCGTAVHDCVRMILVVLRKWRFFGSYTCEAQLRLQSDEKIFIALNDRGVHLLNFKQLDLIRSIPYHRLISFGEFCGDFMITDDRVVPPEAHPEETARERLIFSMPSISVDQLTCHLAEYVRCQKLLQKLSSKKLLRNAVIP